MSQIRDERIRQSMSQKRLAFLAQIDARTLRKIEKGENVSAESFRSVCNVLGIEPIAKDHMFHDLDGKTIKCKARSSTHASIVASLSFILVLFLIGLTFYHFGHSSEFKFLATALTVVAFSVFLAPAFLTISTLWSSPNTVVSVSLSNASRPASSRSMIEAVKDVVPEGRFKMASVTSTGSQQKVVALGFLDVNEYSLLARILAAKGFEVEVRPQ